MHKQFQIHGHRGCRGLYPENTIKAFQHAIDLGVQAIELDIVVSNDNTLIVTHDPWIDPLLSEPINQDVITPESHNIYQLSDIDIQKYKVGTIPHPEFNLQRSIKSSIPTFQEIVDIIGISEAFFYNIEVKSDPIWYNKHQPEPTKYANLIYQFIVDNGLNKHCMVQCFDKVFLECFYLLDHDIKLGYLTENSHDHIGGLDDLSFTPSYYNPNFESVTEQVVQQVHDRGILITPWTVNNINDMRKMIRFQVDGIITDYPNIAIDLISNRNN